MLVNFPVALFSTALLFDLLYLWQQDELWYRMAFYEMVIGYLGAVAAAGVGSVDFILAVPNERRVYRAAAIHAGLAVVVLLIYGVNLGLRLGATILEGTGLGVAVGLSGLGVGLLALAAWYGGELVYVHRVGVREETEGSRP